MSESDLLELCPDGSKMLYSKTTCGIEEVVLISRGYEFIHTSSDSIFSYRGEDQSRDSVYDRLAVLVRIGFRKVVNHA